MHPMCLQLHYICLKACSSNVHYIIYGSCILLLNFEIELIQSHKTKKNSTNSTAKQIHNTCDTVREKTQQPKTFSISAT